MDTTSVAKKDRAGQDRSSVNATKRERDGRRTEGDTLFDMLKALPLEERVSAIDRMAERMGV